MSSKFSAAVAASSLMPKTLSALEAQYQSYALQVRGVLQTTADAERPYLTRFFAWFKPQGTPAGIFECISPDSVIACLVDYAEQYGPGSRRCMQKTVRLFLRFSYLSGYMAADLSALSPSVRSPRMGKLARAISPLCIENLISGIDGDTPEDLRDRAILSLLSTYGVRGVQIRRLRLEDVDWTRSRIHFPAAKRGRPIEQHLCAKAGNRLAEYICKGRPSSPLREIFLNTCEPFYPLLHPRQLSRIIRRRIERAGIVLSDGVLYGSHCFRHAFASRMYGQIPFKDIVDMLGHRDPSTTLIYGKLDARALDKAALPWPGGAH